MKNKVRDYIFGKIVQYHANAVVDAKLSFNLIDLDNLDTNILTRTENFITFVKNTKKSSTKEDFKVASYVYFYWNGYYDYYWARSFEKFLNDKYKNLLNIGLNNFRKQLKLTYYYDDGNASSSLIEPIYKLLINGEYFAIDSFEKTHGVKLANFNNGMMKEIAILVQKANIKSNLETAKIFLDNTDKKDDIQDVKVKFIYNLLEGVKNRDCFLKGCVSTLKGASFWDKVFIQILNERFGAD